MSGWRRRLAATIVSGLVLGACGAREDAVDEARRAASGPVEVRIAEDRTGGSTGLEIGHVLVVELEANPTTGYEWRLADVDPAVLKAGDPELVLPEEETAGAGGRAIWRFEAVGSGTTTLKLEYARPFEPEAPPQKTFTFTVAVGEP